MAPSAAKIVVVHARQVVVNQRIRVQALDRDRGGQGGIVAGAEEFRGREQQDRPEALAAGLQAVAHGLVQPRGAGGGGRHMVVDPALDLSDAAIAFGGEIHRPCAWAKSVPGATPRRRATGESVAPEAQAFGRAAREDGDVGLGAHLRFGLM